jgi:hypothetical protein
MGRLRRYSLACLLVLTSCGNSQAPTGRWEGFIETPTWAIAVRLQVDDGNAIRASALSADVEGMSMPAKFEAERQLKTAIKDGWSKAARGQVDFNNNTMTRTGGVAPLFVFDPRSRTMTFYFYAGGKLTEKVVCLPVEQFN